MKTVTGRGPDKMSLCHYFPSRAAPGEVTSFPGGRIERDPVLANLIQYIIAQEHLNQRVMDYLQSLADLNPQITIGRPLSLVGVYRGNVYCCPIFRGGWGDP